MTLHTKYGNVKLYRPRLHCQNWKDLQRVEFVFKLKFSHLQGSLNVSSRLWNCKCDCLKLIVGKYSFVKTHIWPLYNQYHPNWTKFQIGNFICKQLEKTMQVYSLFPNNTLTQCVKSTKRKYRTNESVTQIKPYYCATEVYLRTKSHAHQF